MEQPWLTRGRADSALAHVNGVGRGKAAKRNAARIEKTDYHWALPFYRLKLWIALVADAELAGANLGGMAAGVCHLQRKFRAVRWQNSWNRKILSNPAIPLSRKPAKIPATSGRGMWIAGSATVLPSSIIWIF